MEEYPTGLNVLTESNQVLGSCSGRTGVNSLRIFGTIEKCTQSSFTNFIILKVILGLRKQPLGGEGGNKNKKQLNPKAGTML